MKIGKNLLLISAVFITVFVIFVSFQCRLVGEAPAVELEIYDGPDFSESDEMCYYRVEAITSGQPEPEIEFGTDDNVRTIGSDRVEAAVEVGDSYTLTVTATNIAGTATSSITLMGECGAELTEEEIVEEAEEERTEAKEDVPPAEEEAEEGDGEEIEAEEPTIELEIMEGYPKYNSDDGVCYYRIKANISGTPSPDIDFNRDDSLSAWGEDIAQINLESPADTFTLNATASNSAGSDSDSIELSWGCEEEIDDEEEEEAMVIHEVTLNVVPNETGTISEGSPGQVTNSFVFAGDTVTNESANGYISFDITSLHGKSIQSASLKLSSPTIYGEHMERQFLGWLYIGLVDYRTGDLVVPARSASATPLVRYNVLKTDINYSDDNLKNALQNNIDDEKSRIQFKLYWNYEYGTTDGDGARDGNYFIPGNIHLEIEYTE